MVFTRQGMGYRLERRDARLHDLIPWVFIPSAFVVAYLLTRRFMNPASWFHFLDHPNNRSMHQQATPRSGGVAIIISMVIIFVVALATGHIQQPAGFAWIGAGVIVLAITGVIDDRGHVWTPLRLAVHFMAGCFLVVAGWTPVELQLPGVVIGIPAVMGGLLTTLFAVWMLNLYNFMDGMDGLAGGMALFGFTTLGVLGWPGHEPVFVLTSFVIAAAASGFLVWNFPPAGIFMGDAGSSVLGFLAAAMSLWGVDLGLFSLWVPLLVFSPFIVDATFTLMRRLLRGEKVWQAHREHLYQRLVQLGWGHKRTLLAAYLLMASCSLSSFIGVTLGPAVFWVVLGTWMVLYLLIIVGVFRLERKA